MPATPSLIVRHDPKHPEAAIEEVRKIMGAIGEPGAIVRPTGVAGNLKVMPEGDAHEAQEAISSLAGEAPEVFRLTSSWTVVDQWVHTDLEEIRRAVAGLEHDVRGGSWKVAVRPSGTPLHGQHVVDAVAPLLHHGVNDLDNPAKEIRIDILGDETGIGIVNRAELFQPRDPPA